MLTATQTPSHRLAFRRQFVMGPRSVEATQAWPWARVGGRWDLRAHPDLTITQVQTAVCELTAVGYLIDPLHPEWDDRGILEHIAKELGAAKDAPARFAHLSGRFVIIATDGADTVVFNDPAGTREIVYTTGSEMWIASQPSILVEAMGLEIDDEYQRRFMTSEYFIMDPEPWWPGETTPYRQIKHLLPNHFLDVSTQAPRRFWPNRPVSPLTARAAIDQVAMLLRGSMRAIRRRFPLALPITAGIDSRTVLAATRGIEGIFYYTLLRAEDSMDTADIWIARKLLQDLHLQHHVIKCTEEMSPEFDAVYHRNVTTSHSSAGVLAEGLLRSYPPDRVSLSGHCSEIARDVLAISHESVGCVTELAKSMDMEHSEFALEQLSLWLEQATPVHQDFGHRVWDLFIWEQEHGVWAANGQSQWDLVHERFTPFNSRPILEAMLATEPASRQGPDYPLYHQLMRVLWPAVLGRPFNPRGPLTLRGRARFAARRWKNALLGAWLGRGSR